MTAIAKLFMNGGSQAIRLPKEFRFEGDEVCVKRLGSAIIVYPKGRAWEMLDKAIGKVDEDFMADRNQPPEAEKREDW